MQRQNMNEGQLTPLRRFKGESHPDFSVFIALIIVRTVEAPFHLEDTNISKYVTTNL